MSETFDDIFDLLEKLQKAKAPNTLAQTLANIKHLRPWFRANCPLLLDFESSYEETWAAYVGFQHSKDKANGKKHRKLGHDRKVLVQALKRGLIKGWCKKSFSKTDFHLHEFSEQIGKNIDDEKLRVMLTYLREHSEKTHLQVLIGLQMGMRISEILKLKKEEVILTDKKHSVIDLDAARLKTRRKRKMPIPITSDVYPLLKAAYKASEGDYIFPAQLHGKIDWTHPQQDVTYWWTKAREHAKVKCRFHDLRHSWMSKCIKNKIPLEWISQVSGATQIVISRVYAHMEQQDQDVFRKLFDKST